MKWKAFKEMVESLGVNKDTEIAYEDMNFGGNDGEVGRHCINYNKDSNELLVGSKHYESLD